MELHPLDGQRAMAQPHDLAVVRFRGDGETCGQRLALDHERVVTGSLEIARQTVEYAFAVVPHARDLAVHHLACAHDLAAERLADRLVSEANAEQRHASRKARD